MRREAPYLQRVEALDQMPTARTAGMRTQERYVQVVPSQASVFVRQQNRTSMVEESLYVRRVTKTVLIAAPTPLELTREQSAGYLGVSLKTVDRLRDAGELDWFYVGASVKVELESIEAFKERQREARRNRQRSRSDLEESKREGLELVIPALEEARARKAAA